MKRIIEIAPKIAQAATRIGRGRLSADEIQDTAPTGRRNITVLSAPSTQWARKVDEIETPFADEYDSTEYANSALAIMSLQEMKDTLRALGVPATKQTDYSTKPLSGKTYLDLGCGTGRIVVPLAALGATITGIDATRQYVEVAQNKVESELTRLGQTTENVNLYQCLAEDFPYTDTAFDGVTSLFGVLNHVEDWKGTINRISRSIKQNGTFALSMYGTNDALVFQQKKQGTLSYKPSLVQSRAEGGILLGDSQDVLPAKFPTPAEIAQQLEASGLQIEKVTGFLRIAGLFPQDPTPANLTAYKELVTRIDLEAANILNAYQTPEEILLAAFLYDQTTQKRTNINDFAYVMFVCRKKGTKK